MYNKQLLKNEWMNEWDCVAKEYEHLYGSYKYTESQKRLSQFTQSCGHKKTSYLPNSKILMLPLKIV